MSNQMADEQRQPAWFEFRIEETVGVGIDAATLGKLLSDLSSAFYAIARSRLGKEAARPGPRTADEEAVAAVRILRLTPGSVIIEAEPPATGLQGSLDLGLDITAEDIVLDFAHEAQRVVQSLPSEFRRAEIRRHVQNVLRDASEVGPTSEVVVRSRDPRRAKSDGEFRVRLPTHLAEVNDLLQPAGPPRRRRLSGHAYMVDVEPGRYRFRLKLPDGRDLTLDADESLGEVLRSAVDRAVEIETVEEVDGDQVTGRLAIDMQVLPSSGPGSMKPPKTLDELAEEQGLTGGAPDYEALASAVWETEQDVADFEEYLREARGVAT